MHRNMLLKKGLVVGIIILFVGVGVYPALAVRLNTSTNIIEDKSSNSELIEIPVQIYGVNGVETHKIQITQKEKDKLDVLIERFKVDLENAKTMKDSVEVYYDMVVSLNNLGLLPDGMNVKSVQRLVTGPFYFLDKLGLLSDKIIPDESQRLSRESYENKRCLLSWSASNVRIYMFLPGDFISGFIHMLTGIWIGYVACGNYIHSGAGHFEYPSVGWIHTKSSQKEWTYEGTFWGYLGEEYDYPDTYFCVGAKGFIGINIGHLFGYARHVKIGTNKP